MDNEFDWDIGHRISNLREEIGLSGEQAAKLLGTGLAEYNAWETGANKFSAEQIAKLAKVFRCSTDFLIFGVETQYSMTAGVPDEKLAELIKVALNMNTED